MSKLSIKGVNLYYGTFHALKDINLEIEANSLRNVRWLKKLL